MAEALGAISVASSLITLADVAWRAGERIREYSDQAEDVETSTSSWVFFTRQFPNIETKPSKVPQ
jgi:hypothetical protein